MTQTVHQSSSLAISWQPDTSHQEFEMADVLDAVRFNGCQLAFIVQSTAVKGSLLTPASSTSMELKRRIEHELSTGGQSGQYTQSLPRFDQGSSLEMSWLPVAARAGA